MVIPKSTLSEDAIPRNLYILWSLINKNLWSMASRNSIEGQCPSSVTFTAYLKTPHLKWASVDHTLSMQENMKGVVILSLILILGSGDASPQRRASSQGARLGAIPFPGVSGSHEKSKHTYPDASFELKCERERGTCKGRCNSLGYSGGGCIDGVCYCHSGHDTTFECDSEKAVLEEHKSCDVFCQLLRKEFAGGECIGGKCQCKEEFRDEKSNKTPIVPTSYWQQTYRR